MTNTEHNILWKHGVKALPDIADQLERIVDQLKLSNMTTIIKERYELGELSQEDYVKELKEGLDVIKQM